MRSTVSRKEGGQTAPLAAALVVLVTSLALALVTVGGELVSEARASSAADAVALAAVTAGSPERASTVARRVATRNTVTLEWLRWEGDDVIVQVRSGSAVAQARARPRF